MASSSPSPSLTLRRAELADVKEMATIFPRSFHPNSEYMRTAIPDTPIVQTWWEAVHSYSVSAPDVALYVVTASKHKEEGEHKKDKEEEEEEIIALARWRFSSSTWDSEVPCAEISRVSESTTLKPTGDLSAGTWTFLPLSPDHNEVLSKSFIGFMASARKNHVCNRAHIIIELVACAHEFKGLGAGRILVEQCIREADQRGMEVFVETNGPIGKFYEKFGFMERERVGMPGGMGYEEIILVRPVWGRAEDGD
ncbi:hypothetical protein E1B28_001896 [Marasmius oreades]|uniref:N-acetyltransferase domain-containing protein n=1 Tax=Marasmius oreades TaxID=181124 RepID=A0A9P7V4C2_9AGAR|nr:uncharacterized protein E1B28_001896 [Marasmius oreades]KAG7100116.1 hypothetical protein E1B28_001896 [Marasmius oreades]